VQDALEKEAINLQAEFYIEKVNPTMGGKSENI
jgi:hypothetical protein